MFLLGEFFFGHNTFVFQLGQAFEFFQIKQAIRLAIGSIRGSMIGFRLE